MNTSSRGFVLLYEQPLQEETFTVLNCGIKTDAADSE